MIKVLRQRKVYGKWYYMGKDKDFGFSFTHVENGEIIDFRKREKALSFAEHETNKWKVVKGVKK